MSSAGPFRLPSAQAGIGALDREHVVGFRFNGRAYEGFEGDTLASALLANGVRTVARSFKFHRPRGVYSCGFEEPNATVQLGSGARTVPAVRSTLLDLYEGLEAHSHAGWPGLGFDVGRILDFTAPLWAAGFYNKTFIWPGWRTYEWLIRRMAGEGHAPTEPDPDRYEACNLHCDVLVVGGGEAGLSAAEEAAKAGLRVVLVEQSSKLGGREGRNGEPAHAQRLATSPDVRLMRRTTAVGYYDKDVVTLLEYVPPEDTGRGVPRERYWVARTKKIVLATGAIEQPLVFCNNDRPGVMLAGAAHQYLRLYGVAVGRRVVIATNNDSAYATARDLKAAGVDVIAIADTRHDVHPEVSHELDIPLLKGAIPVDTKGFGALSAVSIGQLSWDWKRIESVQSYACDTLAISGGWTPALHLYSQAGGKLIYREESSALEAASHHPHVRLATSNKNGPIGIRVSPVGHTGRQWVDLRHDVTVADLELAIRENFTSIEHVKRYTTTGMAGDQGKTSNVVALEIVAKLRGKKPSELGHTTFRPPFMPVTLGAIAGRAVGELFAPCRRTPLHEWHERNGASLEDYGEWKRPAMYPRAGESRHETIQREARAVRNSAGLFDGSSLGKIEVQGPDALEFLDRFYINNLRTLKPGRARYCLMLRETGVLFDDGTVVMISPDHLLVTTTTGNAGRVHAWFEEWHQCEWPHLRVAFTPVTDHWATLSLAGPKSRQILSLLKTDINLSHETFPHLGMRVGQVNGIPVRIYRVSFSGELTYEINAPAGRAVELWDALLKVGATYITPFGIESLLLMRLEKGLVHIGTDTDGTTVPEDIGYGKLASGKQADFVGKRSLHLPENVRCDRLQLVGLVGETEIVVGSHLRFDGSNEPTDGWVTSAGRGVIDGRHIALALLRAGRSQVGAPVTVHDAGRVMRAKVVSPPFYDQTGERMNA